MRGDSEIRKIVFCSGKVWINFMEHRNKHETEHSNDIAFVRLEQISPFPYAKIIEQIQRYPNATQIVWSQEEPMNMGCWQYISPRFQTALKEINDNRTLQYVGRKPEAAPATGYPSVHRQETQKLLEQTFA